MLSPPVDLRLPVPVTLKFKLPYFPVPVTEMVWLAFDALSKMVTVADT